ncbi:MAG: SRPBCC family protein [Phycicoccus sp.]
MTWLALHVSQTIAADPRAVCVVAGDPSRLPEWAAGLTTGIRRDDRGRWIADSPMGEVEVRFTGPVESGVLDHDVVMPDGSVVSNPLRVLANDRGSEVVFTLFRRDGMSDDELDRDAGLVRADLARLAALVEAG